LQARRDVSVSLPGQTRRFAQGERILTEHSYKWQTHTMEKLLKACGFADVQTWTDDQRWFAVMLANA
jgi:L-histidine Nalpha-methyltransferase